MIYTTKLIYPMLQWRHAFLSGGKKVISCSYYLGMRSHQDLAPIWCSLQHGHSNFKKVLHVKVSSRNKIGFEFHLHYVVQASLKIPEFFQVWEANSLRFQKLFKSYYYYYYCFPLQWQTYKSVEMRWMLMEKIKQ